MRIFLVGEFWNGSLGLSYWRALKKMGHEILEFDHQKEYESISPLARNRYSNRLFSGYFDVILNQRLLKNVKSFKPDLVFVIKGPSVFASTLRQIKQSGNALLFNFNPDNPFNRNRGASNNKIREAIPYYDCYFIWGKFLIDPLKNAGARRVEYLPFAFDPELHFPVGISDQEREDRGNDVAFIGTWEKEREEWLEHLTDYDLAIWGNQWEKMKRGSPLRKKWRGDVAIANDYSCVCSASKIVLNFIRKQNGDAHNMRTFEVPACRGFMLTTRTKEQCEFFEEGVEVACFDTPQELRRKVDQFLSDEGMRKKFSSAAYEKVQAQTYLERANVILDTYLEMRKTL
jgi:spore maturation protein CgeB